MIIKEITASEKDKMISISKSDGGHPVSVKWLDKLIEKNEKFFLIEDKKPIGFIAVDEKYKYDKYGIELDIISVIKEYQRKGVGGKLMQKAEELARSLNKKYVYLMVSASNMKAIRFYLKRDYLVCGQLSDRYDIGQHALIMRKNV